MLSFLGLAGPTLALIAPAAARAGRRRTSSSPASPASLFLAAFLRREARTAHPMLPLELFRRRNFAAGNAQTFAMYAGLSMLFFYLVLFLQQVAGYDALQRRPRDAADDARHVRACPSARACSPTASGRGCSWAAARCSRRSA